MEVCLFVCIEFKRSSKQSFSHVGMESLLPGCGKLMCLAQGHNTVPPVGINSFKPGVPFMGHRQTV